jgi:hypothetical protein
MAQGSIEIGMVIIDAVLNDAYLKDTIVDVLTAIDAILLGTVLLVIGYGLYELFVDTRLEVPTWLQVRDLDDLKSKLIGVVVAIIAVVFVGVFVDSNPVVKLMNPSVGHQPRFALRHRRKPRCICEIDRADHHERCKQKCATSFHMPVPSLDLGDGL